LTLIGAILRLFILKSGRDEPDDAVGADLRQRAEDKNEPFYS